MACLLACTIISSAGAVPPELNPGEPVTGSNPKVLGPNQSQPTPLGLESPAGPPGPPGIPSLPLREYYKPSSRGVIYSLQPGWNAISVPLGAIRIVRGLTHQLMSYQGHLATISDPNADSQVLVAGQGYWVFSQEAGQIEFEGEQLQSAEIEVEVGWNLIGCPLGNATILEDPEHLLREVDPSNPSPQKASLTLTAAKGPAEVPVVAQGALLQPQRAYWVYALKKGRLNFGNPPSHERLTGLVTESNGTPIAKAKIRLDGLGRTFWSRSDAWGRFQLPPIQGSETNSVLSITASADSFHPQTVRLKSTALKDLRIKLRRYLCSINISIYSFEYGSSTYRPYRLLMWETKRYSNRTYQTFWNSTSYRNDYIWSNFPMGKEYTIQLTWQDQFGNQLYQTRRATTDRTINQMHAYNSWTW